MTAPTDHERSRSDRDRPLGSGRVPAPRAALRHFLEGQWARYRATWTSTIISSLLFPVFFLLSIGFGLGSQVDDTSSLGTVDYAAFVGPGVLAAVAMVQAGGLSLWPTLGAIKWEGTYQAALATPLTAAELATGHIVWIGFRVLVGASFYLIVLAVFGVVSSPLATLAPIAAALTGMAFAAPLSAFSATRDDDNAFGAINRMVLTPMFVFSGAFFPVEQLPDSVEWIARLVPVSHGVELCRSLVNGTVGTTQVAVNTGYLVLWIVAGWLWAVRTFRARLSS